MKILVTGAAGYIGSVLCPKLAAAGHAVTALDREAAFKRVEKLFLSHSIETKPGDASDEFILKSYLKSADVIIPLAALVGAPACDQNESQARRSNLEAIQLLNRLRARGQRVIYPMTNNGYRPAHGELFASETTPFAADSFYTRTKLEAEQELLNAGGAVSFRLASLFGVSPSMRWDLLLHDFTRRAAVEKKIDLYEGGFKRSFIHIQDVTDCFLFATENPAAFHEGIYNLALESGNISKLELALEIQKRFPDFVINREAQGKDPDARDVFISIEKLKRSGFTPCRSLLQGIDEVLNRIQMPQLAAGAV